MSRLLVVSNRLPVTVHKCDSGEIELTASSGGLASGMSAYLERQSAEAGGKTESLWIGWPGTEVEEADQAEVRQRLKDELHAAPVFLSHDQMEGFYYGFSNRTLWPLFHYFHVYCDYSEDLWRAYVQVNQQFADAVVAEAREDDTIWVHDYQLMLVPQMIREKMPRARIGFFLHIPFPSHDVFRLLPRGWGKRLLEGVIGADLIGFHTYDYTHHFLRALLRILGLDHSMGTVALRNRLLRVDTFPMGIEYNKYSSATLTDAVAEEKKELESVMAGRQAVLSVDRLDYTKGIINRLRAFEHFLETNPDWRERVKLILIVVPSREAVDEYEAMKHQIDETVGRINGLYGGVGWTPIAYVYRSVPLEMLVACYALADAALVTPLRDGMNLVAKEYVACRTDKTGVLILSEMAGAASELPEALLINPNSTEEIADAIKTALEMPVAEQQERMEAMQRRIKRYDVVRWAEDFLHSLSRVADPDTAVRAIRVTPEVRRQFAEKFASADKRLLFLDYDGTLVGFNTDPAAVTPSPRVLNVLQKLAQQSDTEVVVVSGRKHETLEEWLGMCGISIVAEHGAVIRRNNAPWHEALPPQNKWKEELRPILETYVDRLPGSFVEEKQYCLVWHYRNSDPELGPLRAQELIDSLMAFTGNLASVQVLAGNKVVELRDPKHNKGVVAAQIAAESGADFVFAIGDDITDEDMFRSLPQGTITVKVGRFATAADYRINDPDEVLELLEELAEANVQVVK
jgi:trehalose 6-phosphate synthase/phosphatase